MAEDKHPIEYSEDFLERIRQLKADMHEKYVKIGAEPTPLYDGEGREIIRHRPDGYDYIIEGYMRKKLDQYFPGWSWEHGTIQFLGEWIVTSGHLVIIDEYLLAFGIRPPLRQFFGSGADRIQFKTETKPDGRGGTAKVSLPHVAENVVDVDKNVATSNTKALKRAINRLTNIGDDVYGKRIEEEGAGTLEEILSGGGGVIAKSVQEQAFAKLLRERKVLVSRACKILDIDSLAEITDYGEAMRKIKEVLE